MRDYTPRPNYSCSSHAVSAELHITYRCDLACINCNRLCEAPPTTPDMTLDDAVNFVDQCEQIKFKPKIILIGGEPTLHEEFWSFIPIVKRYSTEVILISNQYSERAKEICRICRDENILTVIDEGSPKPRGSEIFDESVSLSPKDFGLEKCPPGSCPWHANAGACGISIDHHGYTICPCGGAIDGMLNLGARTKNLKDLFDKNFALQQTCKLCDNCGAFYKQRTGQSGWEKHATVKKYRGTPMSPTWYNAVKGI